MEIKVFTGENPNVKKYVFLKEEGIIMDDRLKFKVFDYDNNKMHDVIEIMYREDNTVIEWLNSEDKKRSAFIGEVPTVQCTGLKDKNGKLIYEGDIVKMHGRWNVCGPAGYDKDTCVVEFDKSVCGFTPMCNYDCDCCVYHEAQDLEVIGNIYENKELLNDR